MRIAGGLAAADPHAEAARFIEARSLELAVVPRNTFGQPVLDEQLAVIAALER